jgi:hypothetical protein
MLFDVHLPGGIDSWALRAAWLDAEEFSQLSLQADEATLPRTLKCTFFPNPSVNASVTVLASG